MRWSKGLLAVAIMLSVSMIGCGGSSSTDSGDTSTSGDSTTTSGGTSGDSSTSGGSTTSGGTTTTVSYTMQVQAIFDTKCVGRLCHSNQPPRLVSEESYDNLVNVNSSYTAGMIRVIPYDPDNSVLYLRVSGRTLGTQMPKSGGVLSDGEIELIRTWIAEGALYN